MVKAIPMEDWLRGCVYHDGRHGTVTLPTDKVLQIANYIQRTRRSVSDGLIDLAVEPIAEQTEPKRGEWIKHKEKTVTNGKFIDFFPAEYECSNCGLREAHYFINSKPHNYCPNCGAKMDGERGE